MYSLDEILRMSVEEKASDIHFTAGCPPYYRIDGVLTPLKGDKLQPTDLEALLLPILDNRGDKWTDGHGLCHSGSRTIPCQCL